MVMRKKKKASSSQLVFKSKTCNKIKVFGFPPPDLCKNVQKTSLVARPNISLCVVVLGIFMSSVVREPGYSSAYSLLTSLTY